MDKVQAAKIILSRQDAQARVEQERRTLAELETRVKEATQRYAIAQRDYERALEVEDQTKTQFTVDTWARIKRQANPRESVLVGS